MPPTPTPVASIDLHGCKKEVAVRSVTKFLESCVQNHASHSGKLWVCIITGSGHHSPAGPVLRDAVRSLLDKREMEYTILYGKGSFLVNVCSGHELKAGPALPSDSKLVVKPNTTDDVRLINRPHNASSVPHTSNTASFASLPSPKPSEVAADDELIARVKSESEQQRRHVLRHEHKQLKEALMASKREIEWEMERIASEDEERMAAILKESEQEEERLQREEEQRLDEILRHSREEAENVKRQEEENIAAALKQSQEEEELNRKEGQGESDEALNQALQQSLHDVHATDSELNKALSISSKDTTPNEDELLKQALRLSVGEFSGEMVEEQAEVAYIIKEVD